MQLTDDFLRFFFPDLCISCGKVINRQERVLCTHCLLHIPRTEFHKNPGNPVAQLFWGRVKVENAAAFFYFNKGSAYQPLIHKLKYKGRTDIGIEMGKVYGSELLQSPFSLADMIIPVPLHPSKLKKRGYNQSEMFARGLSLVLNLPVCNDFLSRSGSTETQTRKSRFDRFINVEGKFKLSGQDKLEDKHIILADDVVTTGSTLEACANAFLTVPGIKISILSLAVA